MSKQSQLHRIVGHRGACGYAPENTLASMDKAKQLNVTMVEFDVRMLTDRELIILHDDSLERTSNGYGALRHHTLSSIRSLDAGSWFGQEFTGEKIPRLAELLHKLSELNLEFIIELKADEEQKSLYVESVLATIDELWDGPSPIYFSDNMEILSLLNEIRSQAITGVVIDHWDDRYFSLARKHDIDIFVIDYREISHDIVTEIKALDKQIACYTVNDEAVMTELWEMGVECVISDELFGYAG